MQQKLLEVVQEESSDEHVEESKQRYAKPLKLNEIEQPSQ